jgi:hypothetical protein
MDSVIKKKRYDANIPPRLIKWQADKQRIIWEQERRVYAAALGFSTALPPEGGVPVRVSSYAHLGPRHSYRFSVDVFRSFQCLMQDVASRLCLDLYVRPQAGHYTVLRTAFAGISPSDFRQSDSPESPFDTSESFASECASAF